MIVATAGGIVGDCVIVTVIVEVDTVPTVVANYIV